nr:MAG TPA: hypothetical protein [Caudoviricetes sp.]
MLPKKIKLSSRLHPFGPHGQRTAFSKISPIFYKNI